MTVSATSVASTASGVLASIHAQASLDDTLFDLAPVSLWLEDFSRVYELLQSWRETGVEDIGAYLRDHPDAINEYFSRIRVLKVNQRTLDLYGAKDLNALLAAGNSLFDNTNTEAAIAEISRLWSNHDSYQTCLLYTSRCV